MRALPIFSFANLKRRGCKRLGLRMRMRSYGAGGGHERRTNIIIEVAWQAWAELGRAVPGSVTSAEALSLTSCCSALRRAHAAACVRDLLQPWALISPHPQCNVPTVLFCSQCWGGIFLWGVSVFSDLYPRVVRQWT